MGLLTRLVNPPDEQGISSHLFMAALAEFKRGAVTLTQVGDFFNLSAQERTELANFSTQMLGDVITREQVHDVLMLGRSGAYNESTCSTRLLTPAGTNLLPLLVQKELEILLRGYNDCVLAGCAVTAQGSPDMTLAVSKGAVLSLGILRAVTAGNVTIGEADANMPRFDIVVASSNGTKTVRAGTPSPSPQPPALSSGDVALSFVYIPPADTAISSAQLLDCRILRTTGPICIGKISTPVVFNNTNAAQTFISLTVPNGLLLAGRSIHIRCGGTMLLNSGSSTVAMGISYGGTQMFADVSGASTNDTDRLPWHLDFSLTASGNSAQNLNGQMLLGQVAAKTAPTSGVGELAVPGALGGSQVPAPIKGSASVNSDSADRDLVLQFQLSAANANAEVAMDYAIGELY